MTVTADLADPEISESPAAGQVIDEKRIVADAALRRQPVRAVARSCPAWRYTGDLKFSRPFDNGGTSSINADGSTGGNEFTLDGSPNMANGRRVAFVRRPAPCRSSRSQTASFDAADGHTAGAIVERDAQERHQRAQGRGATTTRATNRGPRPTSSSRRAARRSRRSTTTGSAGSSAVRCAPIFDGRSNVLLRRRRMALRPVPEPDPADGADAAMRNGDFSELLAQGIQCIYDPLTAQVGTARVVRTAVHRQHHSREPHQPDRAATCCATTRAEPGRRRSGPQQLLLCRTRGPTTSTRCRRASTTGSPTNSRSFVRYTRNDRRESRNAHPRRR